MSSNKKIIIQKSGDSNKFGIYFSIAISIGTYVLFKKVNPKYIKTVENSNVIIIQNVTKGNKIINFSTIKIWRFVIKYK